MITDTLSHFYFPKRIKFKVPKAMQPSFQQPSKFLTSTNTLVSKFERKYVWLVLLLSVLETSDPNFVIFVDSYTLILAVQEKLKSRKSRAFDWQDVTRTKSVAFGRIQPWLVTKHLFRTSNYDSAKCTFSGTQEMANTPILWTWEVKQHCMVEKCRTSLSYKQTNELKHLFVIYIIYRSIFIQHFLQNSFLFLKIRINGK